MPLVYRQRQVYKKLVEQYPFTYQDLKEIKKVYDYIDPNQGSDTVE